MLSSEDLKQIAKAFGLTPIQEVISISDGLVSKEDYVWWHEADGPKYLKLTEPGHWRNASNYPNLYSKKKPVVMCYYQHQGTDGRKWVLG